MPKVTLTGFVLSVLACVLGLALALATVGLAASKNHSGTSNANEDEQDAKQIFLPGTVANPPSHTHEFYSDAQNTTPMPSTVLGMDPHTVYNISPWLTSNFTKTTEQVDTIYLYGVQPVVQNIYPYPWNTSSGYPTVDNGLLFKQTADAVNNYSYYVGGQQTMTDQTPTFSTLDCGYYWGKSYKGDDSYFTKSYSNTVIVPFRGQGVAFLQADLVGHMRGIGVSATDGGFMLERRTESFDDKLPPTVISGTTKALTTPLDPDASYFSFLVVRWYRNVNQQRTEMYGTLITKNASGVYESQQVSSKSYLSNTYECSGFRFYFMDLNKGSTLWGGASVLNGFNIDTNDYIAFCNRWNNYWNPQEAPEILSAQSLQTYWVGNDSALRQFPAPQSRKVGQAADNLYLLRPDLPTNLGLRFDVLTGVISGTPIATYTGQHAMSLQNVVLGSLSAPFPINIAVSPEPYIEYTATTYTFFAGVGGIVPSPKLNGFSAVTTSTAPVANYEFKQDGSILVGTTASIGTQNFVVNGTPFTGISAKSVTITINIVAKPDVVVTIDLVYPETSKFLYNQAVTELRPKLVITGLPGGTTPVLTFSATPALPAGFAINTTTGNVTRDYSVELVPQPLTAYSVTCTLSQTVLSTTYGGSTAASFDLEIEGVVNVPSVTQLLVNQPVSYALTFSPSSLALAETVYTEVNPSLPMGLVIEGSRITGTPIEVRDTREYAIRTVLDGGPDNSLEALGTFILSVTGGTYVDNSKKDTQYEWYYFALGVFVTAVLTIAATVLLFHTNRKEE